jgi:nucleotide-binding universal stress UspA family protein
LSAASGIARLPASILCPVDFSAHSERALRHAVALAAMGGGRLTALAVNDPLLHSAAAAAGRGETVDAQVEAALTDLLARLPEVMPPVVPAIEIATGEAVPEILEAAARVGADLIVMGTQGLGGARKFVFGSTTDGVIRESAVPVLAVPEYTPEHVSFTAGTARLTFGHVVAAIGLDRDDGPVATAAARWGQATGADLTLSHVSAENPLPVWWPSGEMPLPPALEESTDAARARVTALGATLGLPRPPTVDVRRGSIASSLAAVVRERGAGLLVVSRGGTAHRVGTIAYRVMREADVPTLVVAGSERP